MNDLVVQGAYGALGAVAVLLANTVLELVKRRRNGTGHGAMEQRMKPLEERVHKLATVLQGHAGRIAVAETNIANTKDSIDDIKATLVRMDAKLDRALDR